MKKIQALSITVIAIIMLPMVPIGRAQEQTPSYTISFLLQNRPEGDKTYELNVTITQTLYQYYLAQNHALYSQSDIEKFVTPYALKPIADKLWQIYNNTEDFTNGVLMLVHQIDYQEIVPGKYPIETLVAGVGDCDLFAFIAASILGAGGINTVLLYYKDQLHMEIGVDLDSAPVRARVQTFSVTDKNVSYYIGECTGGKWRTSWRIGETPIEYQNSSVQIITLENMRQPSIEQVSANLRELDPSTVALQVSPSLMLESKNEVTISGQLQPGVPNENVTLQAKINDGNWITIGTVPSQGGGRFSYNWTSPTEGTIAFQASWVGNRQYNGATSAQASLLILPLYLVIEIIAAALGVTLVVVVFVKTGRKKPKTSPQPKLASPDTTPKDPQQPAANPPNP